MITPKYIPLEKGDYCALSSEFRGRCVGEDCPYGHWKDNGCSLYKKTKEKPAKLINSDHNL